MLRNVELSGREEAGRVDMRELSGSLSLDQDGIWVAAPGSGRVSYPEDGNDACFRVEDHSFWFRHRNDCIVEAVRRFPPDGPIVDIGGGNGYVARRLLDEGFAAIVVEPGRAGAVNARGRRAIGDVVCATFEAVGFRPSSVSAAGLFDVLEHLEDDRAAIERIAATMRPGGMLYVTVPAYQWLWSTSDEDARHYRRYSLRQLTTLCADAFEVRYATVFFAPLLVPFCLMRTLPYRLGLVRSKSQARYESEHEGSAGVGLLAGAFRRERRRIRQGGTSRLGTSCLLVARRRATSRSQGTES